MEVTRAEARNQEHDCVRSLLQLKVEMKDALDQQENENKQLLASSDQLINSLKETN